MTQNVTKNCAKCFFSFVWLSLPTIKVHDSGKVLFPLHKTREWIEESITFWWLELVDTELEFHFRFPLGFVVAEANRKINEFR